MRGERGRYEQRASDKEINRERKGERSEQEHDASNEFIMAAHYNK